MTASEYIGPEKLAEVVADAREYFANFEKRHPDGIKGVEEVSGRRFSEKIEYDRETDELTVRLKDLPWAVSVELAFARDSEGLFELEKIELELPETSKLRGKKGTVFEGFEGYSSYESGKSEGELSVQGRGTVAWVGPSLDVGAAVLYAFKHPAAAEEPTFYLTVGAAINYACQQVFDN
ncbi:MAG: hypothetical protein V1820_04745 [archaeon]